MKDVPDCYYPSSRLRSWPAHEHRHDQKPNGTRLLEDDNILSRYGAGFVGSHLTAHVELVHLS